jgi:hypothetical protein
MQLVYELLDAHNDSARLALRGPLDDRWEAHLAYLRDLQRLGREVLAHAGYPSMNRPSGDVHPALAGALARLDEAGVGWCLLRGEATLNPPEGDVDLLVHGDDVRAVRRVLTSISGFVEFRGWGRWPHAFFVGHVPGEDARVKLDVVSELAFGRYGELPTRAGEAVVARRVRDGLLVRPAPADAFWALLLHGLLDRRALSPGYARELEALSPAARADDSPLRALIDAASPPSWDAARVIDAAAARRFDALLAIAPHLRAHWPGTPRAASTARAWFRRGQRYADRRRPRRAGPSASSSARSPQRRPRRLWGSHARRNRHTTEGDRSRAAR